MSNTSVDTNVGGGGRTLAAGFNEGDDQKKLTVLKKAVIALTKQKQEMESTNDALTAKLAQLGGALSEAHETENALRQENEQLREALKHSKGGHGLTMATTLKGLFSQSAASSAPPASSSSTQRPVSPSASEAAADDTQMQLLHVNESLHVQLFEVKTAHAEAIKAAKEMEARLRDDVRRLELENRTHAHRREDQEKELAVLNDELDALRASNLFVQTFLCIGPQSGGNSSHPSPPGSISVLEQLHKAEVPPALTHAASRRILTLSCTMESVTSAIGGLASATKGLWDERRGPTGPRSAEVRRLGNLLTILTARSESLASSLKVLHDACSKEVSDHRHFTRLQISVMQPMEELLSSILPFVDLIVEGSVLLGGRTARFTIPRSVLRHLADSNMDEEEDAQSLKEGSGEQPTARVLRDVAVDAIVRGIRHHLSTRQGVLRTLQILLSRRLGRQESSHEMVAHTLPPSSPSSCLLFLDALQYAHCATSSVKSGVASLPVCLAAWSSLVVDARAQRCIETLLADVEALDASWRLQQDAAVAAPLRSPPTSSSGLPPDQRDLSVILDQVDRSCLMYYTQCQHALSELMARNQQLDGAVAASARLKQLLAEKEEELRSTKEAYEQQLRVLSDTLTQTHTDSLEDGS